MYVVEGDKMVREYLRAGMPVKSLICKKEWLNSLEKGLTDGVDEIIPVSFDELRSISTLSAPHNALALVSTGTSVEKEEAQEGTYTIALETIQDPGNLGTIIRSALWFGVQHIVCSKDSVDCYNPKVVQAAMGGLIGVRVTYRDLQPYLIAAAAEGKEIVATSPGAPSVYEFNPRRSEGILLFGNESKGLSKAACNLATVATGIPGKREDNSTGSLNVAMSVSVVLSEFSRRKLI